MTDARLLICPNIRNAPERCVSLRPPETMGKRGRLTVARCLWPDIKAFFESEEGQREYAEWKAQQKESAKK